MVSFQQRLRDKLATITFTRIIAPDVPEVIMGDATRLLQLLSNLLSNSSKFTPEGGRITLTVDVTHTPPKGLDAAASSPAAPLPEAWLRFQVQDTGVGIAKGACCAARRVPALPSVATFCIPIAMSYMRGSVDATDGHANLACLPPARRQVRLYFPALYTGPYYPFCRWRAHCVLR